jgi:hypothetical protein
MEHGTGIGQKVVGGNCYKRQCQIEAIQNGLCLKHFDELELITKRRNERRLEKKLNTFFELLLDSKNGYCLNCEEHYNDDWYLREPLTAP